MLRLEHAGRRFAVARYALYAFLFAGLAACEPPASVAAPHDPTVAPPSFAKTFSEKFDISGFTMLNPCQPQEQVRFQGFVNFWVDVDETPTGYRGRLHSNAQGVEGVGLSSGDRYRGMENVEGTFEFSSPPPRADTTYTQRLRLIRQGNADNLFLNQTFRFTYPPGTWELVKSEMTCGG